MNTLTASHVSLRIKKKMILNDVSFSVPQGSTFAVIGHNGAGKTTLFHLILGLKFQNSGTLKIFDQDASDHRARAEIGYVPERPYVHLEQTFSNFLKFHGRLMGLSGDELRRQIHAVAEEVGLGQFLKASLNTFSKGMLQKAVLAQSSLGNPRMLILDEPMSGLDPEARASMRDRIILWKQQGKTIIFSSHAMEDVESLADQVLWMVDGKVEFSGTVEAWRGRR